MKIERILKTPYFVLDKERVISNFDDFKSKCEKFIGKDKFEIAYSVKTNSLVQVLGLLDKQGSGFECSSLREMKLCSGFGKGKDRVRILNGSAKKDEEIKFALKNNFLIIVDSEEELERVIFLSEGKKVSVGLRLSFEDGKFGINSDNINEVMDYASSKGIIVSCLHYHQGTQENIKEYEENIKKFASFLDKIRFKFDYLDIGGGFPDKEYLKSSGASLDAYFALVNNYLSKFKSKIIFEPGRVIVNDAMHIISSVVRVKEKREKGQIKNYAILDSGINYAPKITLSSYTFEKIDKTAGEIRAENKGSKKEYLLAGPLLFSNDILGRYAGWLKEGDIIRIGNVGAYCLNLSWDIGYGKPKVVVN